MSHRSLKLKYGVLTLIFCILKTCYETSFSLFYKFNYNFGGMIGQEGAEEDVENINNDDINGEPIETEEKEELEQKDGARKTSKYMTKYERARILGTRALQIRFFFYHKTVCPVFGFFQMW